MVSTSLSRRATEAAAGLRSALLALALLVAVSGCATAGRGKPTLYEELGGREGVAALVDGFLVRVADDYRIADTFAGSNVPRLRRLLEEQFCEVSGGPCDYTGGSMEETHRGMGIRETEFNALVEDLIDAMEALDLPVATQNRLLARLAPMHRDIVSATPPSLRRSRTPAAPAGA
ncbi:MAG: group 1 truncated hemoglobin [Gammaproteobacteria bacterium]|nr:group 1 truncated hemoglobin [Gammaproteobacteria bacterium]